MCCGAANPVTKQVLQWNDRHLYAWSLNRPATINIVVRLFHSSYGRFHGYWLAAGYIYDQDKSPVAEYENAPLQSDNVSGNRRFAYLSASAAVSACPVRRLPAQRRHNGDNVTSGDRKSLFPALLSRHNKHQRHNKRPAPAFCWIQRLYRRDVRVNVFAPRQNTPHCARDWYAI